MEVCSQLEMTFKFWCFFHFFYWVGFFLKQAEDAYSFCYFLEKKGLNLDTRIVSYTTFRLLSRLTMFCWLNFSYPYSLPKFLKEHLYVLLGDHIEQKGDGVSPDSLR